MPTPHQQRLLQELEQHIAKDWCPWVMHLCGEEVQIVPWLLSIVRQQEDDLAKRDEALREAGKALALAQSMILCGEKMSDTAESIFQKVFSTLL